MRAIFENSSIMKTQDLRKTPLIVIPAGNPGACLGRPVSRKHLIILDYRLRNLKVIYDGNDNIVGFMQLCKALKVLI